MSAATASSTDTETIFVRLLYERTDVWRPVPASRLSETIYRLGFALLPDDEDEVWAFQPGDIVVAEPRLEDGRLSTNLFAVARASELDERLKVSLPLAS